MTRIALVLVIAALSVAACGKRGELQRPGLMWDTPAKATPAK
jgi:hypothetical protein